MTKLLFISDLHLAPERPDILQAFHRFLSSITESAEALYILGDLFDAWVGDDDDTPEYAEVASALKKLNTEGCQLYFMHGNRDFLVGERFAKQCGMRLLQDPTVIQLPQGPALLQHGDTLCTDDVEYQTFRAMVRNPEWQLTTLTMPLEERKSLAQSLRSTSSSMNSLKAEDIMDVNAEEVERVMSEHQVQLLIHGHTHRPHRHPLTVNGKAAERIVLGDWHAQGWYLCVEDEAITLNNFTINPLKN